MPFRRICGFEEGDDSPFHATSGTYSVQTSVKKSGNYALRVNPTTTGVGSVTFRAFPSAGGLFTDINTATVYYRFQLRVDTKPTSGSEEIFVAQTSGGLQKLSVRMRDDSKLEVFDSANASLGVTATEVIVVSSWKRVEVKVGTGASAAWELRVDDTTLLSGSTANLHTSNNGQWVLGKVVNRNGNSVDVYYDDMAVSDSAFPGPGAVALLVPRGAGSNTQWTGTWQDVDDQPHDSDTTYNSVNSGSPANAVETHDLFDSSEAGAGSPYNTVQVQIVQRQTGATSGGISIRLKSGATNSDSTGATTTSSYLMNGKLHDVDPNTSAAWTNSGLDAVEVGPKITGSGPATGEWRVTSVALMVDYNGSVPYPPLRQRTIRVGRRGPGYDPTEEF